MRRSFEFSQRIANFRQNKNLKSLWVLLKGNASVFLPNPARREGSKRRERGYAYFQDFKPTDGYVFNVIVVGDIACAVRVKARHQDFRTSGSGLYEVGGPEVVPEQCLELAFLAAETLGTEYLVLELLVAQGKPLIIEKSSYFYPELTFPGFWDRSLSWHEVPVAPAETIIKTFLKKLANRANIAPALIDS